MSKVANALSMIERCDEPDRLRQLMVNARRLDEPKVYDAAFRKLVEVLPEQDPGTVEHAFWQTLHAYEQALSEDRGKTSRLTRTRLKAAKEGERAALAQWALDPAGTEGFRMLAERGMLELSGEAAVLDHADAFEPEAIEAARRRLDAAGYAPDAPEAPAEAAADATPGAATG